MNPILHSKSRQLLEQVAKHGTQALIIYGPEGIGLSNAPVYLAELLNATIQTIEPVTGKDEKVDLENGTVNVMSIRRLYEQTRSKTAQTQIVVISQADKMSSGAQAAFLKLLEEPREGVIFILLTHQSQILLPTISSRAQKIQLLPISAEESRQLLSSHGVSDEAIIRQMLFIGGGRPDLLFKLVSDDKFFAAQAALIQDAKILLQGTSYDKLRVVQRYKDSRSDAIDLTSKLAMILTASMKRSADPSLAHKINQILSVQQRLKANANIRLALARLVL